MKIDVALSSEILGVPESHFERAQEVAARMNRDPLAMGLAQTALDALERGDRREAVVACRAAKAYFERTAPELTGGVYPAVFALSAPEALARMRAAGLSEEIARDTLSDYGVWARAYRRQTGQDGFGEMEWELGFHAGRIVKLGRLQFERTVFHAPYTLYRRGGEIVPVANPGEAVDENGWLAQGAPAAFAASAICRASASALWLFHTLIYASCTPLNSSRSHSGTPFSSSATSVRLVPSTAIPFTSSGAAPERRIVSRTAVCIASRYSDGTAQQESGRSFRPFGSSVSYAP